MLNKEVFATDPTQLQLLNHGVAEVKGGRSEAELRTLEYELRTFVCKGQYESGMHRILHTYQSNLGQSEQPGIWVSGFFGSGKSHFLKVLAALWTDEPLPSGQKPSDLVRVSQEIKDQFVELARTGTRGGGRHAASGTLGASARSVRLGLLAIVFRSVGLPQRYDLARFVMWLRDHNCLEQVKTAVHDAGGQWDRELKAFLVSPIMHQAIADHFPGWQSPVGQIGELLEKTFPDANDVSNEEMTDTIRDALAPDGSFPRTLLAIDEIQQFIGQDSDRAIMVQEAVEECCKRFGASLLVVGTGQAAMSGTPQLLKLKGRFPIEVQLSDADVDTVIREVVLFKKPDRTQDVRNVLERHNGEVSRHLEGTLLERRTEDDDVMVSDYPLLPTRRRFWEQALRAVDTGGTTVQLRNQLRVVYEGVREKANSSLGSVIPGDFLFTQIAPNLVQSGVLPREVHELVGTLQKAGDADSVMKARLVGLVFLIGKLPRDEREGGDLGVRASPDILADLVVEDLDSGSGELRKRLPRLLHELVEAGQLMQVDSEFRVQTRESAAWEAEFQRQRKLLTEDDSKVASARAEVLAAAVKERLKLNSVQHGDSKVSRKVSLHFGPTPPPSNTAGIPVWVRDGWAESESTIQSDAVAAGSDSPLVFLLLPNRNSEDLHKALINSEAARTTLDIRGTPGGEAGQLARAAIETRRDNAGQKLNQLLGEILDHGDVIQAGGQEIAAADIYDAVRESVGNALVRRFPKFSLADNPKWDSVVRKARQGDGGALAAIGHSGNAEEHPVCREILAFACSQRTGADIRKRFEGPTYGWSGDAVDGAIYTLLVSEHVRASASSGSTLSFKDLERSKIGLTKFIAETVPITPEQRIAVRGLIRKAGVECKSGEEATQARELLAELKRRAQQAGGPPPRPESPSATRVAALDGYTGNALINALFEGREQITQDLAEWDDRAAAIGKRMQEWERLNELLELADGLPIVEEVAGQRDAIRTQRTLLAEPDPLPHLCEKVATELRQALKEGHAEWLAVYDREMGNLTISDAWKKLEPAHQDTLLGKRGLKEPSSLDVGTQGKLVEAARQHSPDWWSMDKAGLAGRFNSVRLEAIRLVTPKAQSVALPRGTINNEAELDEWLGKVRAAVEEKLKDGPVVV